MKLFISILFAVLLIAQAYRLDIVINNAKKELADHNAAEQILVSQINTLQHSLEVCIQTKVQE